VLLSQGNLDPTFAPGSPLVGRTSIGFGPFLGANDSANAVAIQPDGKIVVAGNAHLADDDFAIVRLTANGLPDPSFGSGGIKTLHFSSAPDVALGLAIQPDGKIVVVGYAGYSPNTDFAIARLNANGTLDTSFGAAHTGMITYDFGYGNDRATGVAIQPDGKIVVVGSALILGDEDFAIVRYNSNGTVDTTFNGRGARTIDFHYGEDEAGAVVLQPDGKIVVAGSATISKNFFALARLNSNGTLDTTFGGNPFAGVVVTDFSTGGQEALDVALQTDGKIVAVGDAHIGGDNDFAIARYNANGTLDTSFGSGGKTTVDFNLRDDVATGVAIQRDGKIVVAGVTVLPSGTSTDFGVIRLNRNGNLDLNWGVSGKVRIDFYGMVNEGHAVALQPNGKVVVVGLSQNGSEEDFTIARLTGGGSAPNDFNGDGWSDLAVFRPSESRWLVAYSKSGGTMNTVFGLSNLADIPVPADYDGDGKTDLAVFRPATGQWFIQPSDGGPEIIKSFGDVNLSDIPVPADYDGDGKADLAVFRPATGQWIIQASGGGPGIIKNFGGLNLSDIPVPADYDGDGKADLAVFRPATGQWFIQPSDGDPGIVRSFGAPNLSDIPVPADYDGDGRADLAVFRPSEGRWLALLSGGGVLNSTFGAPNLTDIPTAAPIGSLKKLHKV
jgi:uncharacterized delta-60 repeat protein